MKETEIMKRVLNKLEMLTYTKEIIWYSRLNSGKVKTDRSWVQLCAPGTPDIISIINCDNGSIAVLFIECKSTKINKLRFEQAVFFARMRDELLIFCELVNDPSQLWPTIKAIKNKGGLIEN